MKIILKSLKLINFKGIKSLEVDFNNDITYICGANATGKTTIFDAFLWLLFGKDSQDRKDFGVKTLDSAGNEIHRIEHTVTAVIEADGIEKTLSRTMREKWSKQRGSSEEVFSGNETLYEVNNVPCKMSEYQEKISDLVNESLFKLISNPAQFCSSKWQEQRKILMEMADIGSDLDIAASLKADAITSLLESGKTVADRSKELANTKKKIKAELDTIPIRIDEINKSLASNEMRSCDDVQADIVKTKNNIHQLEKEIIALNEGGARLTIENEIKRLEAEMKTAKAEHAALMTQIRADNLKAQFEHDSSLEAINRDIEGCKKTISDCKRDNEFSENMLKKLRNEYKEAYSLQFNDTVCPCCGRPWEEDAVHEKLEAFNADKASKLAEINVRGQKIKEGVEKSNAILADKQAKLAELETQLKTVREEPVMLKSVQTFNKNPYLEKIEACNKALEESVPDTSKQQNELKQLNDSLAELEGELAEINGAGKQLKRISELEQDAKSKAQSIADIEKEEAELSRFTEKKISLLNEAVSNRFKLVKFKLYDTQINGGYTECCEATVNGVPYRDLNNAMKINAGLDIINALQRHYEVSAPIFVDNKESVNKLIELESQLICLVVTDDKKLIINKEVA